MDDNPVFSNCKKVEHCPASKTLFYCCFRQVSAVLIGYWIDSLIALDGLAREHRPLCKYRSDGSRG